jgi:hypothetical protein
MGSRHEWARLTIHSTAVADSSPTMGTTCVQSDRPSQLAMGTSTVDREEVQAAFLWVVAAPVPAISREPR